MKPSNRWVALVVLCLAELLVSIDNLIVNVALPSLSRQLGAGNNGLQWIVDAYTLTFAALLLAAGHLGDRTGRRRMLLIGVAGFGAVSALAALSSTLTQLITARAVMGIFAALIFPATLALISNIFTVARERVAAIGIWSAVAGISVALGPVGGGWLLQHYSWHSVFWINVPLAVLTIGATVRWVPESRAASAERFDVAGAGLSLLAVVTLIWTIIEGPRHGWTSAAGVAGALLSAGLFAALVVTERRVPAPVLNVALFTNRRFSAAAAAVSVAFFGLFGFIFLVTQYFQAIKGYSTLDAGLRTLPFAIVIGIFAPVAVQVAQRVGSTVVITVGLLLMSGGFAIAATSTAETAYFGRVIVSMCLMAAGLGLITGPATEAIMGALPRSSAGAGSAVNDTTRELGGALGVAVLGSVLNAIYTQHLTSALDQPGLKGLATDGFRASAHPSVTAGLDASRGVQALQLAVQHAFLDGMRTASFVAAGATLLGAVLVAVALPARGQQVDDPLGVPASDADLSRS